MSNSVSLNEIAQNVLNLLRGGRSSNHEHISLEQVKHLINYYRTTLIRRDQERNYNRYRMFEQDLGQLTLETVEGPEVQKRTVLEIPTPIRLKRSEAITFVGSSEISKPIPVIDAHRPYWNRFNKFTNSVPEAYYREGHIYITNDITLPNINVRGIFEDPEEVYHFTKENDLDIYDGTEPYPIPQDMLDGIVKGLLNNELPLAVESLNDDETDFSQDEQ